MSNLKNPMRFSLSHSTHDIQNWLQDDKRVTEIDIRPSEGSIYVHWEAIE